MAVKKEERFTAEVGGAVEEIRKNHSQTSPTIGAIAGAIVKVMSEVKGVEKNLTVGSGSYGYKGVGDQDVKLAVRDSMVANGLALVPLSINPNMRIERWQEGNSVKQSIFTEVTPRYLLMHAPSGEWIEIEGYGQGTDPQDKSAGKATTYALKYLLLYTFLIPTGKIDDADNDHSASIATPQNTNPTPAVAEQQSPASIKLPSINASQYDSLKGRMESGSENNKELLEKAKNNFAIPTDKLAVLEALIK